MSRWRHSCFVRGGYSPVSSRGPPLRAEARFGEAKARASLSAGLTGDHRRGINENSRGSNQPVHALKKKGVARA